MPVSPGGVVAWTVLVDGHRVQAWNRTQNVGRDDAAHADRDTVQEVAARNRTMHAERLVTVRNTHRLNGACRFAACLQQDAGKRILHG